MADVGGVGVRGCVIMFLRPGAGLLGAGCRGNRELGMMEGRNYGGKDWFRGAGDYGQADGA